MPLVNPLTYWFTLLLVIPILFHSQIYFIGNNRHCSLAARWAQPMGSTSRGWEEEGSQGISPFLALSFMCYLRWWLCLLFGSRPLTEPLPLEYQLLQGNPAVLQLQLGWPQVWAKVTPLFSLSSSPRDDCGFLLLIISGMAHHSLFGFSAFPSPLDCIILPVWNSWCYGLNCVPPATTFICWSPNPTVMVFGVGACGR